jgi:hypothetical protein
MLETHDGRLIAVEELTWNKATNIIETVNSDLANIMHAMDDTLGCTFYKVAYKFGNRIINNGKCYLPLVDGGSIAFDDPALPASLRDDLSYSKNEDPLAMILSKNSEFYISRDIDTQTQSIIHPGQMFGIPRAVDDRINNISTSALTSNLNAGSRSLFMLSKISDQIFHGKLKEHFKIDLAAPATPHDHWELFVEIANKSNSQWQCEVLYFSRKWINQLKSDDWAAIAKRLMQIHRTSYTAWHNFRDPWNNRFYEIEVTKKLGKLYPMQSIHTAKDLFMLAAGIVTGFRPATNEDSAPIKVITEAYTNIYNKLAKQKQIPIIMEAAKFNSNSKYPIYYSINHSISTQKDLESSKYRSQITRLDEIRTINEIYTKAILDEKSDVESLYNIAQNTTFSYYHSKPEGYSKILNPLLLATEDKRFTNGECETFPANSAFFTGAIKISRS